MPGIGGRVGITAATASLSKIVFLRLGIKRERPAVLIIMFEWQKGLVAPVPEPTSLTVRRQEASS